MPVMTSDATTALETRIRDLNSEVHEAHKIHDYGRSGQLYTQIRDAQRELNTLRYPATLQAGDTVHMVPVVVHRWNERGYWSTPELFEITVFAKYVSHEVHCTIGYFDATGSARRVFEGPVLPGPYAFLTPQATVIQAAHYNFEAPKRIRVEDGDVLNLGGQLFRVQDDKSRSDYPNLVPITA